jgi:hypothetical protein
MFLRTNKNTYGRAYLQIVRSYRENGKIKQEVLFTLGRLDILQATGQLDDLVKALSRYTEKQKLIDLSKDVTIEEVYYLGIAHMVSYMVERLGLDKLFRQLENQHQQIEIPWRRLVMGMIMSRFIMPCSKRRLKLEQWEKIYPELLGIKEPPLHWLYRSMDVVYMHRADIERALFDRDGERDLFNQEIDIIFYDTTTLYFESRDEQLGKYRRFGYSKEHQHDCTQVVLGLLIDRDGIPVGYELFPGNTYDGKSVPTIIEKLKSKYQIGKIIFVADRGMVSKNNLQEIKQAEMEYIVGMRLWKLDGKIQELVYDLRQYQSLGREKKLFIREIDYKGDRLIITWSQDRAERDAHIREQIIEGIRAKLKQGADAKWFVTHKGYRQYVKGLEKGKVELDEQAIKASQKRDGFFGVLTNIADTRLSRVEIYDRYKDLWHIEDAFGEIKGPLETRPVFHWTDRRIEAHILICLLAYYIEAVITRKFRQKKARFTAGEWFRALNEVYAVPVQAGATRAWIRNELKGKVLEGYQLLNLKPPNRVLKIEQRGVVTQNLPA